MELLQRVKSLAVGYSEEILEIRRHIHAHPELSFQEFETSAFVTEKLKDIGIPFTTGWVKTGITGLIKGKSPDKKVVALRADMDALPITEENEVNYKSVAEGVMHACGHDVHTACLLGAAKILNELKGQFEGTVKLIFQPGEEKLPGGAGLMIKEGVLKDPTPDSMFGQHVYPELEVGKVGFRSGMYMASADEIYLTVKGKGGHAALPHQLIDPVLIASHVVVALQQVVSRSSQPDIPSVLSFGKIIGNGATNVIPGEVKLEGTFRTFNEEWRDKAHEKIQNIATSIAAGMGGECIVDIKRGYPFLVNDHDKTFNAKKNAEEYLGKENVVDLGLRMTAEDFAFYSQKIPSCFYRLGVGNKDKGITSNLHSPTFNIDESSLEIGMGLMAWIALREINS